MSKANIGLLKEAMEEIRAIKNGKGITKELDKMEAAHALHHVALLVKKLEANND